MDEEDVFPAPENDETAPPPIGDPPGDEWPKTVYATAGHVVQELVHSQAELDDALANGWRLTETSLSEGA